MVKRIAVLRKDKCKAPEECDYICKKFCPPDRNGILTIDIGPDLKPVIIEDACIGCGICVKKCPFDAITIVNLPQELDEPTHQFGINSFRLFGLPTPLTGKVIGLLGPNGTGKTTCVQILGGNLVPNLNRNAIMDEVISHYAGKEIQSHFKKLRDKKISVAIKPQNVAQIAQHFSGTVEELLAKAGPAAASIAEKLDLKKLFSHKISTLSGGELQRLAIAATLARPADIFFFDEPSSYLDIHQRLKVAEAIGELGSSNSVVLVEHDLTMLDYLSEQIYLFYGLPSVYGIASLPKATRTGINIYLDGYSKDENIRFREEAIKFTPHAPLEQGKHKPLLSFSDLGVRLGSFELEVAAGSIPSAAVIGIVGANGTGKTTFVNLLAGLVKPSRGSLNKTVSVSHKPQYVEFSTDRLVREVLAEAAAEAADLNFESEVIEPLNLRLLLQEQLSQLSGGELQRVAIALAVSKPATLYLLDEPAAFLDVEQRIAAAKFIKRVMEKRKATALVVDHDVLFIDYLSDSLMVFSGEPARRASATGPLPMENGMNLFLSHLGITMRRDPASHRPRINKPGSVLDQEQKASGRYYYT